jgi:hypothetical protein
LEAQFGWVIQPLQNASVREDRSIEVGTNAQQLSIFCAHIRDSQNKRYKTGFSGAVYDAAMPQISFVANLARYIPHCTDGNGDIRTSIWSR